MGYWACPPLPLWPLLTVFLASTCRSSYRGDLDWPIAFGSCMPVKATSSTLFSILSILYDRILNSLVRHDPICVDDFLFYLGRVCSLPFLLLLQFVRRLFFRGVYFPLFPRLGGSLILSFPFSIGISTAMVLLP